MRKSLLFLSLALAVCAPLSAFAADAGAGQSVVERYVDLLYRQKKVDEAMALIAPDLVQHSPRVKDGRDARASELRFITHDPTSSFDVQEVLVPTGCILTLWTVILYPTFHLARKWSRPCARSPNCFSIFI